MVGRKVAQRVPAYRLAVMLMVVVLASVGAAAQAARDDLALVSRRSGAAGAAGDGLSLVGSVSADGRFVAFASLADNLSGEDRDGTADVFVRDLRTHSTTLVSRATGAAGAAGDGDSLIGDSFGVSISADGRFVAFRSHATNLSDQDADGTVDVFVRDLQANTTTLVSRATGAAGAAGDGESGGAAISADGRFVAFFSVADNLSEVDGDLTPDVFVRDLQADTTTLVSTLGGAADGRSFGASISADGRFVAFSSSANNLSPDDLDGTVDVFVRDSQTGGITLASRQAGGFGAAGEGDSFGGAISADGRFVGFDSVANNLSGEDLDGTRDVFVRDLQSQATTYVSRQSGASALAGASDSLVGSISGDGRFVAFTSIANNLSDQDADGTLDVFVRDLQANTTRLVSRAAGAAGAAGSGDSLGGPLSGDGRVIAFTSVADNLSDEDADGTYDVFTRELLGDPRPAPPAGGSGGSGPSPVAADTSGPAISARTLSSANGTVRVSPTGRFRLFCGRYREPVTGTCAARSRRPIATTRLDSGRGGAARRILRLAAKRFSAPADRRVLLRFRLPPRDLETLGAARRVRMLGTLTARDRRGNPTTVSFRFTLLAPRTSTKRRPARGRP
jgi:Tol biopolymer transport system component